MKGTNMLMTKSQIKEEIEKFKKEMVGWTIADVLPPTKDETIMKVVLERITPLHDQKKTIVIGATDLGFWLDQIIKRRLK